MTASATSGNNIEVIPVSELSLGDLVFTDRPTYVFTTLGGFDNSCDFIRVANDDKNTAASEIQITLDIPSEATVYLDFWGGADQANLGFSSWNDDWSLSDVTGTTFGTQQGPGMVFSRNVPRGELHLYGNEGGATGTYYAFVCPNDHGETIGNQVIS